MTREREIEGKDWKRRVWKLCLGEKDRETEEGEGAAGIHPRNL